jgi:CHAD domain-containing protein
VTNRLGTVRELDVLLLSIDELHVSRRARGPAVARVGVAVSKDRDRARRRLAAELSLDSLHRVARKLERVVDDLRVAEAAGSRAAAAGGRWAVEARIVRRAERLALAIREAGAVYLPERLHDVRIALKKMRYALELMNEFAGEPANDDVRMLKRGQDLLGRMHDLQVLIERVRQVQASLAPPTLSEWRDLDALVLAFEDDCRRLHARYMRARDGLATIAGRHAAGAHTPTSRPAAQRAG